MVMNPRTKERLYLMPHVLRSRNLSVKNHIVSSSQPYIRPIVRGKAKSPTEFGAKLGMSIDENGFARLEKLSFDAYNEQDVLKRYRYTTTALTVSKSKEDSA